MSLLLKRMLLFCAGMALSCGLRAELGVGDCVIFREGGEGRVFTAPSYWVKGAVVALTTERRPLVACPVAAKAPSAYSREERVLLARAFPCAHDDGDLREVEVRRVRMTVDSWETPWSNAHGTAGLLFRGMFSGQALVKGRDLEIAAEWLESCSEAP